MAQLTYFLIFSILFIISNIFETDGQELGPTVEVGDLGQISGLNWFTINPLIPYVTFNGIPYAKPESYTGDRRFQPSELWEGALPTQPFPALNPLVYCPQQGLLNSEVRGDFRKILTSPFMDGILGHDRNFNRSDLDRALMGQEECLVLNVNTPKIPAEGETLNYPVIVFIHGGGSHTLWGSLWNGGRLLTEKVVLVTINYRLGILGSLNLGVDEAPGNAAIYDAITSLQWIQKYIHYFGGDPTRVTITGQSAGAMMCGHLIVSPLAKGLFHNVIGTSGSALVVWGTAKPNFLQAQLRVAELAGCNQTDHTEILDCMKNAQTVDLIRAQQIESAEQENDGRGLEFEHRLPSVQSPSLTIPRTLPKHPLEIMKAGEQNDVAVMFGACRHDGSPYLGNVYYNYIMHNNLLNNVTFMKNDLIPTAFRMMGIDVDPIMENTIARNYLGKPASSGDFFLKLPGFIDMATVLGMREGGMQTVELQSKLNPKSYSYSFDHKGMFTELFYGILFGDEDIPGGIAHTEDMLYLFQFFPLLDPKDMDVAERMVKYWSNFAHYGNPNGDVSEEEEFWPRHSSDSPFLQIKTGQDTVGYNFRDHWSNISHELINEGWLFHFNKIRIEHGIDIPE